MQNFVAYLAEHRVVELEEGELHAIVLCGVALGFGRALGGGSPGLFEVGQHLLGAPHDALRHARQPRHVDAERMLRAAALQLAQKDHASLDLAHRYIPVFDAGEEFLHFVQFVVMRGKEGAGMRLGIFVQIFHNGPGNADAVVGGRAASQFVEEHERAFRQVVHDVGGLVHFHHEGALPYRYVVACSDAGENLVDSADVC